MTKNLDKEGLSSIVDDYQLFYVDLWGVVHNGISLHQKAIKALNEITKKNKDYILLTNAPRPNHSVKNFLKKLNYESFLYQIAERLELNIEKFKKDMSSAKIKNNIIKNIKFANSLKIRGTPTFIIGNQILPGAYDYDKLKKIILDNS